jgi:hypothetical protein
MSAAFLAAGGLSGSGAHAEAVGLGDDSFGDGAHVGLGDGPEGSGAVRDVCAGRAVELDEPFFAAEGAVRAAIGGVVVRGHRIGDAGG